MTRFSAFSSFFGAHKNVTQLTGIFTLVSSGYAPETFLLESHQLSLNAELSAANGWNTCPTLDR